MPKVPDKNYILQLSKMMITWMKLNSEVLSGILEKPVSIGQTRLFEEDLIQMFDEDNADDYTAFPIHLKNSGEDRFYLLVEKKILASIIDLLIGGDGSPMKHDIDDTHLIVFLQAVKEMSTTLSAIFSDTYHYTTETIPEKPSLDQDMEEIISKPGFMGAKLKLEVGTIISSNIFVLIPNSISHIFQSTNKGGFNNVDDQMTAAGRADTRSSPILRKASFGQLTPEELGEDNGNIDLVLDIPLQLSVVLGKTGINLRDLIEIKPGAIFSLEKSAGEPVELYVNERFVGYGEVIVIDEKFGVKVIDVVDSGAGHQGRRGM